ncbi:fasciclin-like arabinogalactan protein 9 [Amaranthus tricolor]|uniref:fasciclin-like arabinogalactan protein 9 n=1 Tax=Amaranthus tricolor TaxID=29722 RepID=UPI00258A409E|nr:fasciclin-like arabinogalactan protein 9 [Amaranthus tricolor]
MSSFLRLSLLLTLVATLGWTQCRAQSAPGPAPVGPANLTAILEKGGQFTSFQRLLTSTQVSNQIANQINSSSEGLTVFAPTDNAFQNLKPGLINDLSVQQQVQLVLYHVLPKFYSFDDFQTVSNPVRTQATGQDGEVFGLNIVSIGNRQVNVSTGEVTTQVNNALRETKPLAVYQVDKVLIPKDFTKAKAPKSAPELSPSSPKSGESKPDHTADGPSKAADADSGKNGVSGLRSLGMGFVGAVGIVTTAFLF